MAKKKASIVIPAEGAQSTATPQTSSQSVSTQAGPAVHDHAAHASQSASYAAPTQTSSWESSAPRGSTSPADGRSRKEEYKNYAIVALATALIVVGAMWFMNGSGDVPTGAPTVDDIAAPDDPAGPPQRVNLDVGTSPSLGKADAPVTIIEFSDYQCPFCERFYSQTLPLLKQNYIDTGKVKLVYKDFPLESIHPNAAPAANAARCAGEQGKYWDFHDKIFSNQDLLSASSYSQWAQELGLDTAKFSDCVSSNKYLSAIRDDLRAGSAAGVRGTPAFFINGLLISGAQPFPVFQQVIDAELSS